MSDEGATAGPPGRMRNTVPVPSETVLIMASAVGAVAVVLSPWMRGIADGDSRWLTSGLHVLLAALGGAGAAVLARNGAEVAAFGSLALAFALLVTVDLAEHRLPDAIVLPTFPVFLGLLAVGAGIEGEWGSLGRAVLAAAVLGAFYLALAWISPSGLGLGDVKLAGLIGAFLGWFGWSQVLLGTFAGFLLGGGFAIVLLTVRRADRRTPFAFGPWMIAGAVAVVAWEGPWP